MQFITLTQYRISVNQKIVDKLFNMTTLIIGRDGKIRKSDHFQTLARIKRTLGQGVDKTASLLEQMDNKKPF